MLIAIKELFENYIETDYDKVNRLWEYCKLEVLVIGFTSSANTFGNFLCEIIVKYSSVSNTSKIKVKKTQKEP